MRVLKIIPVLFIILLAFLPSCKETVTDIPMATNSNVTYGYSIEYPQNWTKYDTSTYQFAVLSPETTTAAGGVSNSLAGLVISATLLPLEETPTLEEFYRNIFNNLSQSGQGTITEVSAENADFGQDISGYAAQWKRTDDMGVWEINWHISLVQNTYSYFYVIWTYSHKNAPRSYKAALESAVNSFKYVDITVTPAVSKKMYTEAPPMTIDVNKQYTVTMTTEYGDMVFQLFPADAPKTVNSFVFLIREGYYDDTVFHRVEPNFVVQGGDPTGTGLGGPGYYVPNEISSRQHLSGTLSMANGGADTNGSQFFICYGPQPTLDGNYSVFGQLIQGTDVLNQIEINDRLIKVTVVEQ